jgi:chemotaxis family two-component system sensor kinase Cph1
VTNMKYIDKTKEQLTNELIALHKRNAELERSATNHKQTEEELIKVKDHLNNIIESSLDGIVVGDSTGNIVKVNDSFLKLIGCLFEEVNGKHIMELSITEKGIYESTTGETVKIDEEYFNNAKKMTYEKLFKEGKITNWEAYYRHKDKKIVPVEMNITYLYNERGEITGSVGIIRDITERKKAIATLKKSEEKYHKLIELANAGIIVAENNKITQVNRKAEEIYGYSREELIGQSPRILTPDKYKEQHKEVLNEILTLGELGETNKMIFEEEGIKKDGSLIPTEISFSLELEKDNMIIAVVRDITERKKAEEERKQLLEELNDKNKELEQVFYIASHDLRSPLVNIQGFSKELDQALKYVQSILFHSEDISSQTKETLTPTLEEDIPEAFQYILASISKMDSLLSGLLRLSRLGRAALNIKNLDMNKLVLDITKSFEYQVKEKGVTLKINKLPPCLGDETQINQVFSNLIDNALKYLDPTQTGAIKISGRKENGHAVYYIKDNGIGIAPEHQERIYEIFHRLNPAATQGEGLGLTVTRKILERHTGKIWVESEPGRGSKFIITLPTH